MNETFRDLVN